MISSPNEDLDIKKQVGGTEMSDPITPKLRQSSKTSSSFDSPRSPLFSKEDQVEMQQSRRRLEMEIITLDHKLKSLQTEFQTLNSKLVSHGELTQLKAQTRLRIYDDQYAQANQLIDDYINTLRSVRAAQASIAVLEQKIQEESERRHVILDESISVLNALDFSDIRFASPKLTEIDDNVDRSSKIDMDRLNIEIQNTQNSISLLENTHQFLPIQTSVASEMKKSFEAEIALRSIGIAALRTEIQANQKLIASSDVEIRRFEAEINEIKKRIENNKKKIQNDSVNHEMQLNLTVTSFKQQISQLDTEIDLLKSKLSDTALIYDKIVEETKIMETKVQSFDVEEEEEIFDNDEYYSIVSSQESEDEIILSAKKKELISEISELDSKFREMKKEALKRENFLKETIIKMSNKFRSNKTILARSGCVIRSAPPSPSSSGINRSLDNLILKIDNSLSELTLSK